MIGGESFKVDYSISSVVLRIGQKVHEWLKEPSNFNQAEQFTNSGSMAGSNQFSQEGNESGGIITKFVVLLSTLQHRKSFLVRIGKHKVIPFSGNVLEIVFSKHLSRRVFQSSSKKQQLKASHKSQGNEYSLILAGYEPRALHKKSANPLKRQLLLWLLDLFNDEDEGYTDSEE